MDFSANCHKLALWLSAGCALLLISGTIWHQELWANYSPISQTISSLSALGVPYRESMTNLTILGALGLIGISIFLNHCGFAGRVFLATGGISLLGVAIFPVPSATDNSTLHTLFAAIFLIAMCLWPVAANFGHRAHLWAVPIRQSLSSALTLAILGICFWLNWLISTPIMGLVERVFLVAQFGFLTFIIRSSRKGIADRVCLFECSAKSEAAGAWAVETVELVEI